VNGPLRTTLSLALIASCTNTTTSDPNELPSPEPPPSWGVPITGATMLVTRDGTHAVVADPDRDRIVSVDLVRKAAGDVLPLTAGDEPGRLVEDGAGRIHVALRRGGAIVTLASASSLAIAQRRDVCPEPRGLAWDATTDLIHVACTGGELVSLPAAGGPAVRTLLLDRDLRDVIVSGDRLLVTRFRSAELLTLDAAGAVISRVRPPTVTRIVPEVELGQSVPLVDAIPAVAWRTIALPDGRIVISHQRQVQGGIRTSPGGYRSGCDGGPVEAAMTVVRPGGAPEAVVPRAHGTLPVDVASDADGNLAFVLAGSGRVQVVPVASIGGRDDDKCGEDPGDLAARGRLIDDRLGAPTAVGFRPDGDLVIFHPELPAITIHSRDQLWSSGGVPAPPPSTTIELPGPFGYDSGRALFHGQTGVGLACASCHPEGREDGLVWTFAELGPRRTQSLAGHILRRAPYHWGGDMADLGMLMDQVFTQRMAGGAATRSQRLSLGPWLDRIPAPAPVVRDVAAIERGRAVFDDAETACTSCHNGELLTNSMKFDVGKGVPIKVPSLLGVGARAPFMHDGCAATLADRFGACGGGDAHGKTSQLTAAQLADLVALLESL